MVAFVQLQRKMTDDYLFGEPLNCRNRKCEKLDMRHPKACMIMLNGSVNGNLENVGKVLPGKSVNCLIKALYWHNLGRRKLFMVAAFGILTLHPSLFEQLFSSMC